MKTSKEKDLQHYKDYCIELEKKLDLKEETFNEYCLGVYMAIHVSELCQRPQLRDAWEVGQTVFLKRKNLANDAT
jgi:hypothetical protein